MAGTRYIVEIDLRTRGDLGSQLAGVEQHAAHAERSLQTLSYSLDDAMRPAEKLVGAFDHIAHTVTHFAMLGFGAALAGGVATATYGVMGLNKELEQTQIALATIYNANGASNGLAAGMGLAANEIAKMRADAAALPGEFEDLVDIYKTGAIDAFRAGLTPDAWRKEAARVMATGAVAGLNMQQTAREFAMLLEGRSGAHNVFGMRLMGLSGSAAQHFNHLSAAGRLAEINKQLDKYGQAISLYNNSMESAWTTMLTNVKTFVWDTTRPLFGQVKADLRSLNTWFTQNQDLVGSWAQYLGQKLVSAWDLGKHELFKWGPLLIQFADTAEDRLVSVWHELEPYAERFSHWMQEALADPNHTIDKLVHLAELYAALKGVVGVGHLASLGMRAYGGYKDVRGFLMGGAAGGFGLLPRISTAAAGYSTSILGGASGGSAFGVSLSGGAALATLAASAAAAAAGVGAAVWQYEKLVPYLGDAAKTQRAESEMARRVTEHARQNVTSFAQLEARVDTTTRTFEQAGNAVAAFALNARMASLELAHGVAHDRDKQNNDWINTFSPAFALARADSVINAVNNHLAKNPHAQQHPGGGGGTHIERVEIVVTSNNDPSRVAREVVDEIAKLKRNRGSSPDVRNFSGASPGF